MKLVFFLCLAVSPFFSPTVRAVDFEEHPYFSRVVGKWMGEGEFTTANGDASKLSEEWSGTAEDDGSFKIVGTREWNGDTLEFRWVFHQVEDSALYEVDYWQTGMDEDLRFEASVTENRVDLKAPFGDSGGELRISTEFVNGNIEGTIEFTDGQGQVGLGGQVIHTKSK